MKEDLRSLGGCAVAIVTYIFIVSVFMGISRTDNGRALGVVIIGPISAYIMFHLSRGYWEKQEREKEQERHELLLQTRREEAEERAKIQAIEAHKKQQHDYHQSLAESGTLSFASFTALPKHLENAEACLDQAEKDFSESAFSPFWDSVERAAVDLGNFDNSIRIILHQARHYNTIVHCYEGKPPPYPIILDSVTHMAVANTTADRMKDIVRKAQCDFHFATIYEQRKTNQLLIAGFTTLAQALQGMANRIESSINNLSSQISGMSETLDASLQNLGASLNQTLGAIQQNSMQAAKIAGKIDGVHGAMLQDAAYRAERHKEVLTMLDNIQRRRRPGPHKVGDGAY